jgi:hypothetical protein
MLQVSSHLRHTCSLVDRLCKLSFLPQECSSLQGMAAGQQFGGQDRSFLGGRLRSYRSRFRPRSRLSKCQLGTRVALREATKGSTCPRGMERTRSRQPQSMSQQGTRCPHLICRRCTYSQLGKGSRTGLQVVKLCRHRTTPAQHSGEGTGTQLGTAHTPHRQQKSRCHPGRPSQRLFLHHKPNRLGRGPTRYLPAW